MIERRLHTYTYDTAYDVTMTVAFTLKRTIQNVTHLRSCKDLLNKTSDKKKQRQYYHQNKTMSHREKTFTQIDALHTHRRTYHI